MLRQQPALERLLIESVNAPIRELKERKNPLHFTILKRMDNHSRIQDPEEENPRVNKYWTIVEYLEDNYPGLYGFIQRYRI